MVVGLMYNIHHPVFSAFLDLKNEFSKIDEEDGLMHKNSMTTQNCGSF